MRKIIILLSFLATHLILAQSQYIFQNNFNNDQDSVGVGLYGQPAEARLTPYIKWMGSGTIVNLIAYEPQSDGSYTRIWNDIEAPLNKSAWKETNHGEISYFSNDIVTTFTSRYSPYHTYITAYLRKLCNITFSNQFSGTSEGGQIKVNGVAYSAPKAEVVVEQNPIIVEGVYQTINDIGYSFRQWSDGVTTNPRTFYPSSHQSVTAQYLGIPVWINIDRNLQFNTYDPRNPETRVQLSWNEHPNSNVTQYEIWRYECTSKTQCTSPSLQGTVSRGTTTWTDIEFNIGPLGDDYVLYYDVKAVFAPEGTKSSDHYVACNGNDARINKEGVEEKNGELIVKEYLISNFPNPFNPSTTINYQLPIRGHVSIKVYDMLGKEVAELVNETKEMGIYNAEFSGRGLSSGVYVYTINVDALTENGQNYTASKKMLMMK